jgi:hypothetical protein
MPKHTQPKPRLARVFVATGAALAALGVTAPAAFALHADKTVTEKPGYVLHVYLNDTLAKSCGTNDIVSFNNGHAFAHREAGGGTLDKSVSMKNTFEWDLSKTNTSTTFGWGLTAGTEDTVGASVSTTTSTTTSTKAASITVVPSFSAAHPGSVDWYYNTESAHATNATIFQVWRAVTGNWEINDTFWTVNTDPNYNNDVC